MDLQAWAGHSIKNARSLILQYFIPMLHLSRVYAKLLGDFGYCLNHSDRFKCDLGF
jgi:hypothetical protein